MAHTNFSRRTDGRSDGRTTSGGKHKHITCRYVLERCRLCRNKFTLVVFIYGIMPLCNVAEHYVKTNHLPLFVYALHHVKTHTAYRCCWRPLDVCSVNKHGRSGWNPLCEADVVNTTEIVLCLCNAADGCPTPTHMVKLYRACLKEHIIVLVS